MYKKIAPLCYLTPLGFIIAVALFANREDKTSLDKFHLRQSFGLYLTGIFFYLLYKVFNSELFSADLSSLIILVPLLVFWFLGFKWAMEDKEKKLPVIGSLFQKWFTFV